MVAETSFNMRLILDTDSKTIDVEPNDGQNRTLPLYSREAFELVSGVWLQLGWNAKYTYTFSWLGRPVIQLPEDMIRIQEVITQCSPDIIIETGVAHGGSLVYYASLCHALGKGRVVGIDIEIRPHNLAAIKAHRLSNYIDLVVGSSIDPSTVAQVKSMLKPNDKVLVILDSNHTKGHVRAELDAYHALVTPGSYIVATDGIMEQVCDVPRGKPDWRSDNPAEAAREFASEHPEFLLETPKWPFCESELLANVTHWPSAYLRRLDAP